MMNQQQPIYHVQPFIQSGMPGNPTAALVTKEIPYQQSIQPQYIPRMMMGGANANYGQVPLNNSYNTSFSDIANPNYIATRPPPQQQQPQWLQQLPARQQQAPQQLKKDTVNVDAGGSFVRVERDAGGHFVQVRTTSPPTAAVTAGSNVYQSGMKYAGQPLMYQQDHAGPVYQPQQVLLTANTMYQQQPQVYQEKAPVYQQQQTAAPVYQQQAQPVYQQPQQVVAQPVYQMPQTQAPQPQIQNPIVSQVYNQPQPIVYQFQSQPAPYQKPPAQQYQAPAPSPQHNQPQVISKYQPSSPNAPRRHSIHHSHQQKFQYDERHPTHYSSSTTLKEQQKKFNTKKPQPQVKALSTSERYQQYKRNSFSSTSSSSLSEDVEFEPYSYRDWLNLKSRDGSMKLPASIGAHEDAGGRDKIQRMNEYASKQQRNRSRSHRPTTEHNKKHQEHGH